MKAQNRYRPELRPAADCFRDACAYSRMHSRYIAGAMERWGNHGAQISGCIRDHFPEPVKEHARWLAKQVTLASNAAYSLRPRGVHVATMRRLANEIARRDGTGFYGPQEF